MKSRWTIGVTLLLLLSLAGFLYHQFNSREPTYRGKKISAWIDEEAYLEYKSSFAGAGVRRPDAFIELIKALGTNALPYVVQNLARNDSVSRKRYSRLRSEVPGFIKTVLPSPKPLLDVAGGTTVFMAAGTNSIPIAIALLKHKSPTVRESAAMGLAMLRRQSSAPNVAIPALIAAMDDSDHSVSFHATQAFEYMGPDASNAVPALTKALVRTNSAIGKDRSAISLFYANRGAAAALGKIGPSAATALPQLRKMLEVTNADTDLRGTVAVAIWRISGDVDTTLPALLQEMSSQSEIYQEDWVAALGEMGPRARPAVPQLIKELKQPGNVYFRGLITNALQRIDPDVLSAIKGESNTHPLAPQNEKPK